MIKKSEKHTRCYRLSTIFIVLCVVAIVMSATMLFKLHLQYKISSDLYSSLADYAASPITETVTSYHDQNPTHGVMQTYCVESDEASQTEPKMNVVDFSALREINHDIAAWLTCDGTRINYPIVQGNDNSFYLNHLFDGKPDKAGCLFIDSRNTPDFADKNTVIYGHNMKNNSMFAVLIEYKKQAFYDFHPDMLLLTPQENYVIEIFSGYVTDTKNESWKTQFNDRNDFSNWIANVYAKSMFVSGVEVSDADRIITLSTCTYEFEDARYVLHGKLVAQTYRD